MIFKIHKPSRLDVVVFNVLNLTSRSQGSKLIKEGKVRVNGEVIQKSGFSLKIGDKVAIDYQPFDSSNLTLPNLEIIYEDDDCVVINKPTGLLTHSKGSFNPEATVGNWLVKRAPNMEASREGIVHRLDRATSGVMILAKTPTAMSHLQKQFSARKTKKTYVAVITGHLSDNEAKIDLPIERNPKAPQTFRVGINGKSAQTTYRVFEDNENYSMIELKPYTGRTHQLRVHLSHLGHPIVGDTLYGGEPATRLYLHALSLEITLPSKERRLFSVELPKSFKIKARS